MARIVRSARGEAVDFDLIKIKDQLAKAKQSIDVAKRQVFIDNKESGLVKPAPAPAQVEAISDATPLIDSTSAQDLEFGVEPLNDAPRVEPPAPIIPSRKK